MNPTSFSKEDKNSLNSSAHAAQQEAGKISQSIEKFSHDAGKKVGSLALQASDEASHYVEASREYIRGKPIQAAAIAVGAGVVAGFLLTMMARRKS